MSENEFFVIFPIFYLLLVWPETVKFFSLQVGARTHLEALCQVCLVLEKSE